MAARYRLNHAAVNRKSQQEAIRLLSKVASEVERAARFGAAEGPYWTGNLAASIKHKGPRVVGKEVVVEIGSSLKYAASVDEGATIHEISAKKPGGRLVFFWHKKGKWMKVPYVIHPGQKGKGFLRKPMRRAAARHGLIYVEHP